MLDLPPPPPAVLDPVRADLVRGAVGQRLALSVPVSARPDAGGRTIVRLRATVRLPGGANLRPTPSTRQHADGTEVAHRVLFSPASTRRLTRLDAPPRLTVRAFAAHDADGDGAVEAISAPATVVVAMPRVRRRPPAPAPAPAPVPGGDPCAAAAAGCVIVTGDPWLTAQRWSTRAWRVGCPPNTVPKGAVAVETPSTTYELSRVVVGTATWIEVTDDTPADALRSYTPSAACGEVSPAAGG